MFFLGQLLVLQPGVSYSALGRQFSDREVFAVVSLPPNRQFGARLPEFYELEVVSSFDPEIFQISFEVSVEEAHQIFEPADELRSAFV